jgi:uronate dehydrogenase
VDFQKGPDQFGFALTKDLPMNPPLVLVTGSAGHVGRFVVRELTARGHPVRGFDRVPTPGLTDFHVGDVMDPAACHKALAGVTTLVHLAATPDDVPDPVKDLFGPNIVGVYNVFEAARAAGVKRMILASSCQVVWNQRATGPMPITTDTQPTPRSWYAATKMFLEGAGRAFADAYGISVVAVRLGWCPRAGQEQEIAGIPWAHDVYFSPNDAGRFFACAVEAKTDIRFAVIYASSKPVRVSVLDLGPARTLLGYEPENHWPEGMKL